MREQKRTLIGGRVTQGGVSLTARPKAVRASSNSEVVGCHRPAVVLKPALQAAEDGLAQLGEVTPFPQKASAVEREAVGGRDHGVVIEVHSHKAFGVGRLDGLLKHNVKIVPLALPIISERSRFGGLARKQRALVVADSQREAVAAMQERKAHSPVSLPEAEDALIVSDGLGLKVPWPSFFGLSRLDGIGHTADGLAGKISTQAESFPQVTIDLSVQAVAASDVGLRGLVQRIVTGVGESLERGLKGRRIFMADLNLALNGLNEIHRVNYIIKGESQADSSHG